MAVCLCLLPAVSPASTVSNVGQAMLVRGQVTATAGDVSRRVLQRKSPVYAKDIVETGQDSFTLLRFVDNTRISVRADSRFVVSEFRVQKGRENVGFELIKGGLRILTGAIAKRTPGKFRINTSRGQIGIRGTEFDVRACTDDCAMEQAVLLGLDTPDPRIRPGIYAPVYRGGITGFQGRQSVDANPGQTLLFSDTGIELLDNIPRFMSEDPTPRPSANQAYADGWQTDLADDLELDSLESPVLQPVKIPGVDRNNMPDLPVYEQQPEGAQDDFQPPPVVVEPVVPDTPAPSVSPVETSPNQVVEEPPSVETPEDPDPDPPPIIIY